jgi:hypothetical protein
VLVDGYVVELVAEAGCRDEVRAHVQRDGDELVVGHLALVIGPDDLGVLVDALDHEVGLDGDVPLREQRAEPLAGHRLGERAVQRGDEDDLGGLAHALALEVVIREEDELQRAPPGT